MLSVTAPVSPAASVGLTAFAEWAAQGPSKAENIRDIYASFAATDKDTIGKLLREVPWSEEEE